MKKMMKKEKRINIDDIKITDEFKNSKISAEKIIEKTLKFHKGEEDEIVISEDFTLLDGYITYLIRKVINTNYNWKYTFATVVEPKFYIIGKHINSLCTKNYIWEINKDLYNKVLKNKEDNIALVETKYGNSFVKIKSVFKDYKSPVNTPIKKVISVYKKVV